MSISSKVPCVVPSALTPLLYRLPLELSVKSLVDPNYLDNYLNSFYLEEYSKTFPATYTVGPPWGHTNIPIGNLINKAYLNTFEYMYSKANHNNGSFMKYRNAKQMELIPGFNAELGSVFLAYIEDYECDADWSKDQRPPYSSTPGVGENYRVNRIEESKIIDKDLSEQELNEMRELYRDSINSYSKSNPEIADLTRILYDDPESNNIKTSVPFMQSDTFAIYPNPTSSLLNTSCSNCSESSKIQICDMQSRIIFQSGKVETQIDLSFLSSGVYILRILHNSEILHETKLIKF